MKGLVSTIDIRPQGPMKDWAGNDVVIQSWSGMIHQTGNGTFPMGTSVADGASALALAFGIMSALYARKMTGKGQMVTLSLLHVAMYLLIQEWTGYLLSGKEPPHLGRGHSMVQGIWQVFDTKDRAIVIGGVPQADWPHFCHQLGLNHLTDDPRFANPESRIKNRTELFAILRGFFASKNSDEVLAPLWKVGVRAAPVLSLKEAHNHPLLGEHVESNLVSVKAGPLGRKVKVVGPLVEFSGMECSVRRPTFSVGEHNHEVLLELGYTWEDIAQMINDGVLP